MSERLVIVVEYEAITKGQQSQAVTRDDMQQALTDAMTQIREGADRLDPNHVKVVGVHVGVDDFVDRVLTVFDTKPEPPHDPLRSDSQPLAAPERPDAPDAPNGLTSGPEGWTARTGATPRSSAETDREEMWTDTLRFLECAMDKRNAENDRLRADLDEARATIASLRAEGHARPASDGCGTGCDECEGKP